MKNFKTLITLFIISLISINCNKKNANVEVNEDNIILKTTSQSNKDENKINLIGTKWIIGYEGLNGEKPDTIHFISDNKMKYVSADTGSEILSYTFLNDTLSYTDKTIEYDLELDKDVVIHNDNKLVLKNNKFYKFYFKTNDNDEIYDLSETSIFRKVQ